MKKGICVAGNLIVDLLYPIERYPAPGELTTIGEGIQRSTGGLVCNCAVDLAKLDPALPLTALGVIGADAEGDLILEALSRHKNIDVSHIAREGRTSFTAVMSDARAGTRTFFQYRGANSRFCARHVDWDAVSMDILHVGYLLLLDALDAPDAQCGTQLAALLREAQRRSIRTSIDVVTEAGNRFQAVVPPALRYADYCVINEIEAEKTTGVPLRGPDGALRTENMAAALSRMFELGVGVWAVIHAPEGSFGRDAYGRCESVPGAQLPAGYIRGTVGAGDAFCSGVLLGAYREMDLHAAMELGTAAAVASLSAADATGGVVEAGAALRRYRALCGDTGDDLRRGGEPWQN